MGNELHLKIWVKFRRERLERRKSKIHSRTVWASMDRVGQSGECSQGPGECEQEVSTCPCPNLMPRLQHRLWETSRMIRHCFSHMKNVRTPTLALSLCRP